MKHKLATTFIVAGAATMVINDAEALAASTYTVQKGDSLASIARNHHTSMSKLQRLNNLSGQLIYVGQKLKVSEVTTTTVTQTKKTATTTTKDSSYTVKSGDSLGLIALRTGVSVSVLKSLNNLSSDTIFVGQTLKLSGSPSTNVKTTTASYTKTPQYSSKTTKVSNPITTNKSSTTTSNSVTSLALKFQGVPYAFGGSLPSGFDCSGFIYYIFKNSGYNIGRTSVAGYRQVAPTIKANELRPGDIVFFQNTYKQGLSHMGIYLGGGKFVHAGTSTGVTIASVYDSYWSKHLHSYGRFNR